MRGKLHTGAARGGASSSGRGAGAAPAPGVARGAPAPLPVGRGQVAASEKAPGRGRPAGGSSSSVTKPPAASAVPRPSRFSPTGRGTPAANGGRGTSAAAPSAAAGGRGVPAATASTNGGRGVPVASVPAGRGSVPPARSSSPAKRQSIPPTFVPSATAGRGIVDNSVHSFGLKVRRVLDHAQRNPHRSYIDPDLVRVIAHWTTTPQGTVPLGTSLSEVAVKRGDEETVKPPADSAEQSGKLVNARALIIPGPQSGNQPLQRRMQLVGGNYVQTDGKKTLAAYGGIARAGAESKIVQQLERKLAEQCALDLTGVTSWYKLLELQYRDRHPTVFWVPALWEAQGELKTLPQATEESYEAEEQYFDEEPDEEAHKKALDAWQARIKKRAEEKAKKKEAAEKAAKEKAEKAKKDGEEKDGEEEPAKAEEEDDTEEGEPEMPMKKVKKTRTVTKIRKTHTITPRALRLNELIEMTVTKGMSNDTRELCAAADALDEFLRRECAAKTLAVLKERKQEADAKKAAEDAERAKRSDRKRKRDEEDENAKRARKERDERLKELWADEDSGMTDEEKAKAARDRAVQMQEQRKADAEEDLARRQSWRDEDAAEVKSQPKIKRTTEVDEAAFSAVRYFDRSGSGAIPRITLESVLLSLDEDMSLGEARELLAVPQVRSGRAGELLCKSIAEVRKEEVIPDPEPAAAEEKQEGDAKMEEKEEAAKADEKSEEADQGAPGEHEV